MRAAVLLAALAIACNAVAPTNAAQASPCTLLCERIAECGAPPSFAGVASCTRTCADDPKQTAGSCREPRIAYERCMIAASCDDVRASADLAAAKQGPCGAAIEAVLACDPVASAPAIDFQF